VSQQDEGFIRGWAWSEKDGRRRGLSIQRPTGRTRYALCVEDGERVDPVAYFSNKRDAELAGDLINTLRCAAPPVIPGKTGCGVCGRRPPCPLHPLRVAA
jgi:hypothetical protein